MTVLANVGNYSGAVGKALGAIKEGLDSRERKQALADLDINSNESLAEASRKLLATGKPENIKLGIAMDNMVRSNKMLDIEREGMKIAQGALPGGQAPRNDIVETPLPPAQAQPPRVGPLGRPEVPSTSRMVGDQEAIDKGLYDPLPAAPAARRVQEPQQLAQQSPISPQEQKLSADLDRLIGVRGALSNSGRGTKALDLQIERLTREKDAIQKERLGRESEVRKQELDVLGTSEREDIKEGFTEIKNIREKARNSTAARQTNQQMARLLDEGMVMTGPGAEATGEIAKRAVVGGEWLKRAGIVDPDEYKAFRNIKDFAAAQDQFKAYSVRGIYDLLGGFGKNITDRDREEMYKTYAGMGQSVEANKSLIRFYDKVWQLDEELSSKVSDYTRQQQQNRRPIRASDIEKIKSDHDAKAREILLEQSKADRERAGRPASFNDRFGKRSELTTEGSQGRYNPTEERRNRNQDSPNTHPDTKVPQDYPSGKINTAGARRFKDPNGQIVYQTADGFFYANGREYQEA